MSHLVVLCLGHHTQVDQFGLVLQEGSEIIGDDRVPVEVLQRFRTTKPNFADLKKVGIIQEKIKKP